MESHNISITELGKMMREIFRALKKHLEEVTQLEVKISSEQFRLLHAISIKEEDVIQKDMAEKVV